MALYALRKRLLIGVGVATIATASATGAFGVSGSDTITTIAGNGKGGFSGDGGAATSAPLVWPQGVVIDRQGNIFAVDQGNLRVRKVNSGGTISTIAGNGKSGYSGDGGPATSATLRNPYGVAVDGRGNVYIADHNDSRVRKVSSDGTITTFAGSAGSGYSGDGGPATSAKLYNPYGLAVDGSGNVYIADWGVVRKVNPGGTITTIAGTWGRDGCTGDGGPATSARLSPVRGVAVDGSGNVYIASEACNTVRKVTPGGTITTIAGTGARSYSGDGGPATAATLYGPRGVAVDGQGNVYIADTGNSRIRKVSPGGTITTVAGGGSGGGRGFSGDGGPATAAQLNNPGALAVDAAGNLYISDTNNHRVRKISAGPSAATSLTLSLGGASSQQLLTQKGTTVTAQCSRPCSLSATGSVTIVGTKYLFRLTRATAPVAAGKRTLTLRCSTAQLKRFRKLFKPGQRAQAVISVKAKDKTGRTSSSKRTVVIR